MDGWLASESDLLSDSGVVPTAASNLRLYQSALAATIRALQAAGKQVILVQDTPSFAVDPLLLVRAAHIPVRRALALALNPSSTANPATLIDPGSLPREETPPIAASLALLQQSSGERSVELFDPQPALCPTPTQCNYRDADTLLFIDSTHLSAAGAARALAAFPLPAENAAARP